MSWGRSSLTSPSLIWCILGHFRVLASLGGLYRAFIWPLKGRVPLKGGVIRYYDEHIDGWIVHVNDPCKMMESAKALCLQVQRSPQLTKNSPTHHPSFG